MNWVRERIAGRYDRAWGRISLVAVAALTLLSATLVIVTSVVPASAGAGDPSAAGVQPTEESLGGQPNDCPAVGSLGEYELRIENPSTGNVAASAPAGVSFDLTVAADDEHMDFSVNGAVVVVDVVVKGGSKSTHFDYEASTVGAVTSDAELHAPTKGNGNNLFNISHVSFCYTEAVEVSGTVMVDANADADLSADTPEQGRVVRAYSNGSAIASATSDASGAYTMLVPPTAGSLLVCEDVRAGYVQIGSYPDDCSGISGVEAGGHAIVVSGAGASTLDFDNALEVCGQILSGGNSVFTDVDFELFGDSTTACEQKAGDLTLNGGVVELPIVGPGTVAGFGRIEKVFPGGPSTFEPLEFSRENDGTFVDLQWCGLRAKDSAGGDGDQFDPYVPAGQYPSLTGVDYGGAEPDVSCKVYEEERIDGTQVTVVYFDDDPYWQ